MLKRRIPARRVFTLLVVSMVRPLKPWLGRYGDALTLLTLVGVGSAGQWGPDWLRQMLPNSLSGWTEFAIATLICLLSIAAYRLQERLCQYTEAAPDIRYVPSGTKIRALETDQPGKLVDVAVLRLGFANEGNAPAEHVSATMSFSRERSSDKMTFKGGSRLFGMWFVSGDRKGETAITAREAITLAPNGLPELIDIAMKVAHDDPSMRHWKQGVFPLHRENILTGETFSEVLPADPVYLSVTIRGDGIVDPPKFLFLVHGMGLDPRVEHLEGPLVD